MVVTILSVQEVVTDKTEEQKDDTIANVMTQKDLNKNWCKWHGL